MKGNENEMKDGTKRENKNMKRNEVDKNGNVQKTNKRKTKKYQR